ncbi:AAA-domain-containing protein [Lichtheimia hyalospora FSU 10163]|nr:AAA-domain-containing protein [Lichtheimia hyalospora FSU 10163]
MPQSTLAQLVLQHDSSDQQVVTLSSALWERIAPVDLGEKDTFPVSIRIPCLSTSTPINSQKNDESLSSSLSSILIHAKKSSDYGGTKECIFVSAAFIETMYGPWASARLDDDYEEFDTDDGSNCIAHIEAVQLAPLDEIVIGALDASSFQSSQQDEAAVGKLLASKENELKMIIRAGGRYTFDGYDFKVLMTSPVQQGYIMSTENTRVLVVDLSSEDTGANVDNPAVSDQANNITTYNMLEAHTSSALIEPQEFIPRILQRPWPVSRLFPEPRVTDDDENRLFIGIKDLARCGVFSGDWILVSAADSKKSRLCRVYGVDDIDLINEENRSFVYLPPVLYFNLGLPLPPTSSDDAILCLSRLNVAPSETGPNIASAVSIARVASSPSMDKSLQNAFLEALKQWFEEKERILCNGDLIVIRLNEEQARLHSRNDEESVHQKTMDATTLAYFKVTSMEEEELNTKADNDSIHPTFYGHGRRIVPSHTKMIQTGIEHSRAPIGSLTHYYDLVNKLPLHRTQTPAYNQLFELISSSLHPLGRDFQLSCNALVQGPRGGGKATLVHEVAEDLGIHLFEFSACDIVSETDAKTEVHMRAKFDKAASLTPCIMLIRMIEDLAQKSAVVETGQEPLLATVLQECIENVRAAHASTGFPIMVIATTSDIDALPTSILGCFRHEVVVDAPDETARLRVLQNLTCQSPVAPDVSLPTLATQTAALVGKDLVDLVARAGVMALQRVNKSIERQQQNDNHLTADDIKKAGVLLTAADFDAALNEARASYSDSIGAPKIPNVTWDDVGGLAHVKDDILDTVQLPLEHPELFGAGLKKRSGILLYGPPGTGKTLLAKAIATSCSLNFFSVKGPELLNMYIGESEANVRRVFQRARDAKPCVVFFDELDSVAPKRGEKGDSGGVMDRIVSQLLAELDGMSEGGEGSGAGDVFVIGATNRPDLLDPALLRPGRFDKLLYLGVSDTHEAQLRIIQALTRKFRLHPDLDLMQVAERCPFHYTGADFYALCSDAMLKAMTRVANTIEAKVQQLNEEKRTDLPDPVTAQYYLSRIATKEETIVQVEQVDFLNALDELVPSVSATELAHYQSVRAKFEQSPSDESSDQHEQEQQAQQEMKRQQEQKRKSKGKGKARAQ